MSAEVLRQAAAEMRRIAENATPGRWKLWGMSVMADQDGTSNVDNAAPVAHTGFRDENGKPRTWDACHIAGMQPAVALAVADWLEQHADYSQSLGREPGPNPLTVARAYLGSA